MDIEDYDPISTLNVEENIEIINAIAINLLNIKKYDDLEVHVNKYIFKHNSYILNYLKGYCLTKKDKLSESENYFKKSINIITVHSSINVCDYQSHEQTHSKTHN